MNKGDQNVLARLNYAFYLKYGRTPDHVVMLRMFRNWQLAKGQLQATYLSQPIEDQIIRLARPK